MKRIILLMLVAVFIISGCQNVSDEDINDYSKLDVNKEVIKRLEDNGSKIINIGEYSYVSEKGKITGTYDLDNNEVLVFVSKGKPDNTDTIDYKIFIDESTNPLIYSLVKSTNGDRYIKTSPGQGHIFELQNQDIMPIILNNNGAIDIDDSINKSNKNTIGFFHNTILINGHIVKKSDNGIYRETFYGNEETSLVNGNCVRLQSYSGRIYYIKDKKLYSINPDGTDNRLISDNDVADYLINDQGLMILSIYPSNIKVRFKEHGMSSYKEIFTSKGNYRDYKYSLIGIYGDKIYFTRRDVTKSWLEILAQDGEDLKILIHNNSSILYDFKPIISADNIFYIVRNGIYKYNIKENTDLLVANILYTFGPVHAAGTP